MGASLWRVGPTLFQLVSKRLAGLPAPVNNRTGQSVPYEFHCFHKCYGSRCKTGVVTTSLASDVAEVYAAGGTAFRGLGFTLVCFIGSAQMRQQGEGDAQRTRPQRWPPGRMPKSSIAKRSLVQTKPPA